MESGTGGSALSGRQSQRCPRQAALLAWLRLSSPPGNKLQNGIFVAPSCGWVLGATAHCPLLSLPLHGLHLQGVRAVPHACPHTTAAGGTRWLGHLTPWLGTHQPMAGPPRPTLPLPHGAPWGWVPIALLMGHPCPMAACTPCSLHPMEGLPSPRAALAPPRSPLPLPRAGTPTGRPQTAPGSSARSLRPPAPSPRYSPSLSPALPAEGGLLERAPGAPGASPQPPRRAERSGPGSHRPGWGGDGGSAGELRLRLRNRGVGCARPSPQNPSESGCE